jgi:hypothetical protein
MREQTRSGKTLKVENGYLLNSCALLLLLFTLNGGHVLAVLVSIIERTLEEENEHAYSIISECVFAAMTAVAALISLLGETNQLRNVTHLSPQQARLLNQLVYNNLVPDYLRGRIWLFLAAASSSIILPLDDHNNNNNEDDMREADSAIERDIQRTFPMHALFEAEGSLGQEQLGWLLRAYARTDPDVGYAQGMGFIAAFFLTYVSFQDAFVLLQHVMRKCNMRALLSKDMRMVTPCLNELSRWVGILAPEALNHMNELGVDATMYASQWLLTLFAYNFSLRFVAGFFDRFLMDGWVVWYKVALALVVSKKDLIVSAKDMEACLAVLRREEGRSAVASDENDEMGILALAMRLNVGDVVNCLA